MEKKISNTNDKLKSQDKPAFHRAKGKQTGLTTKDKNKQGEAAKIKKGETGRNK